MNTCRSRWSMAIVAAALLMLAAACTPGDEEASDTTASPAGMPFSSADDGSRFSPTARETATTLEAAGDSLQAEPPPDHRLGTGGIEPVIFQPTGRDIIFTADLTVAVTDVALAGEEATRLIQGLGGFLFGQQTAGAPEHRSVLIFKVLPEDFQIALDRLGSIGELRTQNVSADDVTERIVDLESRIRTAAASVERLRSLLEGAADVKTIVELENELLQRETQLETLRGQLRTLENQVDLATIVLTLTEAESRPAVDLGVSAYPGHDNGLSCPGDEGLTVDQDGELTVCYEVTNVGDTLLRDFELRDPVLDIVTADLVVVFGDPAGEIEPGESILLAGEIVADRSYRTQTTVTATPIDEGGNPLPRRSVSTTAAIFIEAVDPGGIPTFGEGLQASWELLVSLAQLLVLAAGVLVPFVWVPLVLWLLWRLLSGRSPAPSRAGTPGEAEPATPSDA